MSYSSAQPLSHDLRSYFIPWSPFLFRYHPSLYAWGGGSVLGTVVECRHHCGADSPPGRFWASGWLRLLFVVCSVSPREPRNSVWVSILLVLFCVKCLSVCCVVKVGSFNGFFSVQPLSPSFAFICAPSMLTMCSPREPHPVPTFLPLE